MVNVSVLFGAERRRAEREFKDVIEFMRSLLEVNKLRLLLCSAIVIFYFSEVAVQARGEQTHTSHSVRIAIRVSRYTMAEIHKSIAISSPQRFSPSNRFSVGCALFPQSAKRAEKISREVTVELLQKERN